MGSGGERSRILMRNETYIEQFCDDNVAAISFVEDVVVEHRLVHVTVSVLWVCIRCLLGC